MSTKTTRKKAPKAGKSGAPRRAAILSALATHDKPLSERALFQALSVSKGPIRDGLMARLQRMQTDGQVFVDRKGRYGLPHKMDMVRGRIIGHAKGFGFLTPDTGGGDLFVPAAEMRKVLHGDRVIARVNRIDRKGRREAAIVEVLERGNESVVGRFVIDQSLAFVIPDDSRIGQDIFVPPDDYGGAGDGDIVVAEIKRQPSRRQQPVGKVVEVLGKHLAPGMEIEIAVRKYGLPHVWPQTVEDELKTMGVELSAADAERRTDLRELPLVTIDGADARDFDDAVYCEPDGAGWRLIVAIADVSHYVLPGTGLNDEARSRGNSVYFPEQVIPMLPELLSNNLCSLNPAVDRLCFACDMRISNQGEIENYRFFEGVMHSSARLTYDEVAAAVVDNEADTVNRLSGVMRHLKNLYVLSKLLNERRARAGTVDFDLPETRIIFDQQRKIESIRPTERNDAHRLIEECMLAANISASRFLTEKRGLGIYRVHETPDSGKLEDVRRFLGEFGISLGGGAKPTAGDYARALKQCAGQVHERMVQMALLRSMSQAVYSAENLGHFALGFDSYTHFTSPIRRYSDLIVHREIKRLLTPGSAPRDAVDKLNLEEIADHCSMTERRADDATRNVVQWLKAEFMLDHIGETYDGLITSVTDFGIFVELSEYFVEGLVHVTGLGDDYFRYDPVGHRLYGERGGASFRIGDAVRVKIARVDLDEAKIDFELVGAKARSKGKKRKRDKHAK